jgi:predicted transcriptional regulator
MGNVYRVGSLYGTEYFNTAKDANRFKSGDEHPESIIRLDAAGECNRLERYTEEAERATRTVRWLLEELRNVCPTEIIHETEIGRRVNKFIAENPLPPADSCDREGERSYGI